VLASGPGLRDTRGMNSGMNRILLSVTVTVLAFGMAAWAKPPAATPDPVAGNPQSSVRVIIYQDLECPDCAQWHAVLESTILPKFGKQVAFEFRDFPLRQHRWSFNAAVLARYFDTLNVQVGLAWRDYCFTHQDELTPDNLINQAAAWAAPHGVSRAQIEQVFSRSDLFAKVTADLKRGNADQVQHTPTVLLNGKEATTPEQLEQMLTQALRVARR